MFLLIERRSPRHLGLPNAALLVWSPLVAIGLAPLTLVALCRDPKTAASWPNLVGGGGLALTVAAYFGAHYPMQ